MPTAAVGHLAAMQVTALSCETERQWDRGDARRSPEHRRRKDIASAALSSWGTVSAAPPEPSRCPPSPPLSRR